MTNRMIAIIEGGTMSRFEKIKAILASCTDIIVHRPDHTDTVAQKQAPDEDTPDDTIVVTLANDELDPFDSNTFGRPIYFKIDPYHEFGDVLEPRLLLRLRTSPPRRTSMTDFATNWQRPGYSGSIRSYKRLHNRIRDGPTSFG